MEILILWVYLAAGSESVICLLARPDILQLLRLSPYSMCMKTFTDKGQGAKGLKIWGEDLSICREGGSS